MDRVGAAFLIALIILAAGPACANSSQGVTVMQKWKGSDTCARQAQTAFPDFTPDANAKREARMKACLEGQGLPPRDSLTPGH
jgi:hypothetical protein